MEETRIVGHRTAGGEFEIDSYDASQLFSRAYEVVQRGDCTGAVVLYDQLVREFPTSRFVSPSLYNAGLCLQRQGSHAEAVERFAGLLTSVPGSTDANAARFQMLESLVELERWDAMLSTSAELLTQETLRTDERLEAMSRRAQALLGLRRFDDAERAAREATAYFRTRQGDDEIADDSFAAAAQFVIAEALRGRSEQLELPDADVVTQRTLLDRRSALLLEAQRAYFDTIRFTNPRWSAAAGYRIGAMYQSLYDAVTHAPVPPPTRELGADALEIYRASYREQLADRVRPLVRAAIRYWELTLLMVERTDVARTEPRWVERTRSDLERSRTLLLGSHAPTATPPAPAVAPSETAPAISEPGASGSPATPQGGPQAPVTAPAAPHETLR